MKTLKLPYRGDVQSVAAHGPHLYLACSHDDMPACGAYRIDLHQALNPKTPSPESSLTAIALGGGTVSSMAVATSDEAAFVLGEDGVLYRVAHDSAEATAVATPFPVNPEDAGVLVRFVACGGCVWVASDAGLVGYDTASGAEQHRYEDFSATITALAARPDGSSVAVGHSDGGLTLLVRGGDGAYERRTVSPHDAQIDVVALVQGKNTVEAVAYASDLTMSHTRLDDYKATLRVVSNGNHTSAVSDLVVGPRSRFYTLGTDGEVREWTKHFSTRRPSSSRVSASKGCVMTLPFVTEKGEIEERPHLVLAGRNSAKVSAYDIVSVDEGDDGKTADDGKLDSRRMSLDGAMAWAEHLGRSAEVKTRTRVVEQLGVWQDVPSLDKLMVFARDDTDKSVRTTAFNALTTSTHPRLGPLMEQLLKSSFVDSAKSAFGHLRVVMGESSLRPMTIALSDGRAELGQAAVSALGERYRAGDPVARAKLMGALDTNPARVARKAAVELEKSEGGAAGVLLGLRSNHVEIQTYTLERLFQKNLLGEVAVQNQLRGLRESDNERVRTHAFLVTLLSEPSLATFVRAGDEEVHKQLVVIEASAEGLDAEERQALLDNPPSEDDATPETLTGRARALIMELSTCQQSDISLLGVVAQARTHDPRALPVLLLISQDRDAVVRLRATVGLSALATMPAAEQRLRALIDDKDARVRAKAFTALVRSNPDTLSVIASGLNSAYEDTRMSALSALQTELRAAVTEASRGLLEQALFNRRDLRLAREASKTLRQLLEEDRGQFLRTLLKNPHEELVEEAIGQLGRMVREAAEAAQAEKERLNLEGELGDLVAAMLEVSQQSLRQFGFERVHKVLKRSNSEDALLKVAIHCKHDDIRQKTLEVLDPRDAWNQFVLRDALHDDSRRIRTTAWEVIVKTFKEEKHAEILKALLEEGLGTQHQDIREAALGVVLGLSMRGRRDLLWQALFDTLPSVRTRALEALLTSGDTQAALAALNSPYRDLRVQAARGLAKRGDARAMPSTLQTLKQPKPKEPASDASKEEKYVYQEELRVWYKDVEDALAIVAELGDESAFEPVRALLVLLDSRLDPQIVKAMGAVTPEDKIEVLAELIDHPSKDVALEAARSLARSGDVRGVRYLWEKDASAEDRQVSALTLGRAGAQDFVLKLIHASEQEAMETLYITALQSVVTGGSTLAFSAALTANNSATRLLSAMLLERSYGAEPLFERAVEVLARYSRLKRSELERFRKEHGEEAEPPTVSSVDWRRAARLLAHASARVRARVIPVVLGRLRNQLTIQAFVESLATLSERFGTETQGHRPTDIEAERAKGWAVGAYAGIVRSAGAVRDRLKALTRLVDLDEDEIIGVDELRALLEVAVMSSHADLRERAMKQLHARRERFSLTTRDVAEMGFVSGYTDNAFAGLLLLQSEGESERVHAVMRERDDMIAYMAANVLLANALTDAERFSALCRDALRSRCESLRIITANRLCYLLEQYRFDTDVKEAQAESEGEPVEKQREALLKKLDGRDSLRDKMHNDEFIGALLNLARASSGGALTEEVVRGLLLDAVATDNTGSPYPDVRRHIAVSLARIAEPGVLGVLRELLASDVEREQQQAIEALSTFKAAEAAEALMERMVNDPSSTAQVGGILSALARLRRVEVVEGLLGQLRRRKRDIVQTVLQISGHDAPIPVTAVWDDMTEEEREAELKHERSDAVLAKLMSAVTRAGAYDYLGELLRAARTARSNDQGIDEALAKLAILPRRSDTDAWRHEAVDVIGWRVREREGSADALIVALGNKDMETRFRAAEGLALGGRDEGLDELLRVARSSDSEEVWRKRSIKALGELGDIRAVQFLLDVVSAPEKYEELFLASLEAIGHMSHSAFADQIFSALKQAVENDSADRTLAGLRGLHRFNTADSWALMREQARSRKAAVRELAVELLVDDLDRDAALDVLLNRIEKDKAQGVMTRALTSARKLVEKGDVRPEVAAFKARAHVADVAKSSLDALLEHGDVDLWLELMVYGRREDAQKGASRYDTECQRLEGAIRSAERVPVAAAVSSLSGVVSDILEGKSSAHAALQALFDALIDFIGSAGDAVAESGSEELGTLVNGVRSRWVELDGLVARGRHSEVGPRSRVEHVWRRMLELLGSVGTGSVEIAEALSTPRVSAQLTQSALLALEQLPGASRAACRELAVNAAEHDVRVLAATLLTGSDEDAAATIHDAIGDLSVLQRLTSKEASRLAALRAELSAGQMLAAYEMSRLGDIEGLVSVWQNDGVDEALRLEVLSAMGASPEAVDALAELGRNAGLAQIVRDAAWKARRRSKRALEKQQQREQQEVAG